MKPRALAVAAVLSTAALAQPVLNLPAPQKPPAGPTPLVFNDAGGFLQGRAFAVAVLVSGGAEATRASVQERLRSRADETLRAAGVTAPLPTTLRAPKKVTREALPTFTLLCALGQARPTLACTASATSVLRVSPGRAAFGVAWVAGPPALLEASGPGDDALLQLADEEAARLASAFASALEPAPPAPKR